MDLDAFRASLASPTAPDGISRELVALWEDARGDWDGAHRSVQDQASPEAAWVHAYLHRKEGDRANAQHWYRRAGREMPQVSLAEEWGMIATELLRP